MQIAYNWLMEYLPEPIAIERLEQILTGIGLEVEAIEKEEAIKGGLQGFVIGYVESCSPHPNADKLKLTTVSIGEGPALSIVCGAPNVAQGQKVIVATVGTQVYPREGEPFVIKKSKIRGESSEGMLCSESELGLGQGHDGILVLPDAAPTGMAAKEYFKIPEPEYTLHIGLTPNRSDGNSHIGVARDVCAYMAHHENDPEKWKARLPLAQLPESDQDLLPFEIKVEAMDGCPRYAALALKDVHIGPSPDWMANRLKAIGVRPINNVVDATNYVLHELGQPLHAFDYDYVNGPLLSVKKAQEGTPFTALDDKERKLDSTDLIIADNGQVLGLAGVMGGSGSGIKENTRNILLESAYFDPKTIRRTSLRHGLRTDAATHFEKGVDIDMVIPALQRAASLILETAGGQIASALKDNYPKPIEAVRIKVHYTYISRLCGKKYSPETIKGILSGLGFTITDQGEEWAEVMPPSNKTDIRQPADIAEEVLRIDGLDNIAMPAQLKIAIQPESGDRKRKDREKMALFLSHAGGMEIMTNSITNSKYYPDRPNLVKMINSLSSELDAMRPEMLESGLEVIAYNLNRKNQDLFLFEIGNTYAQKAEGQYVQNEKLSIWLTGKAQRQHWQHKEKAYDSFYLKSVLANLMRSFGIDLQEHVEGGTIYLKNGKETVAKSISVEPQSLKLFDIKQAVYYAEVDLKSFFKQIQANKVKYMGLPKFPAMKRDLSLVLDRTVTYDQVEQIARTKKWDALKNYELFDLFESEKLGPGKKSLALSFTFQLNDRTLTDDEVDAMMQELIGDYRSQIGAIIRE